MDIIAKAIKVLDMTEKQLLADCRPKLLYYSNTYGSPMARPCMLCGETVQGKFEALEAHVKGESSNRFYGRSFFKPCARTQAA